MRIAICGAGSVGKSTLLEAMREDKFSPLPDETEFITEVTRSVGKKLPINAQAQNYDETQLMIAGAHLHNLSKEHFVVDRCLIDGFVYTNYLWQKHKCSVSVRELSYLALDKGLKMYDHIFFIPIESRVKLENDGVRSTDPEFRKDINHHMDMLIKNLKLDGQGANIHTITGTVEERLQTVNRIIKNGR